MSDSSKPFSECGQRWRLVWAILPILVSVLLVEYALAATYECLTTPNGIPRKVIVKARDAVAYHDRTFDVKAGELKFFRKYFVFEESRQGFLVGEATQKSSILGWARRDDVLAWNTEQAVFLINKKSSARQPVRIWQSKDDVGREGKPCFEESLEQEHTSEPFPILEKNGDLVKVAFLWDAPSPLPALAQGLEDTEGTKHLQGTGVNRTATAQRPITDGMGKINQIAQDVRRMDIVLVMDVTGSMRAYMDEVKARMAEIVNSLSKMKVGGKEAEVHVGVVAYRDYIDQQTTFTTKLLNLTSNMTEVTEFLDSLTHGGGGGKNEAVCDALQQACEKMNWGQHSFRIMCLVGDAPPHTPDDPDTKKLRETKVFVESEFFARPFEDNVKRVAELIDNARAQFYALGVGADPEMKAMFPKLVSDEKRFLLLENSKEFISALDTELRKSRAAHDVALGHLRAAADPNLPLAKLTDEVHQTLRILNVDAEDVKSMRGELIQTGWFKPNVGEDAAVCVYMRRRDLEDWGVKLRTDLLAFREKQQDILQGIAGKHLGPIEAKGITEVIQVFDDVAYTPEILRLQNFGMEDEVKVRQLRKKLNNIEIMLLMNKLFSKFEEGWVPMEYLPGALSDLRSANKGKQGGK